MRVPDQEVYDAYVEIKSDLIKPILKKGLDCLTIKRLYESKAVYLENLRIKCFKEMNVFSESHFTEDDYHYILNAAKINKEHLRNHIFKEIKHNLDNRRVI